MTILWSARGIPLFPWYETNMPENKRLLECLSHWDDSCIKWLPFVAFCKWKMKSLYWILESGQQHTLLLWKGRSFRALLQVMQWSSHPGSWSESMASGWFCFECFWIMFWLLAMLQQELIYLDSPGISVSSSPWFIQDTNQSAWLEFVLLVMVFSLMVMLWQELIHLESLCHLLQDLWWLHYATFVNKEGERLYNKKIYVSGNLLVHCSIWLQLFEWRLFQLSHVCCASRRFTGMGFVSLSRNSIWSSRDEAGIRWVGYNLGHHLTQDIPMIPFLYGFQNWVLDEVCFLFFDSLESHGLWKICLLSIINILDAWHACCWLWTYSPPRELKIHASEKLLTKCWQKPKLYKKTDIVMNLQKLVLWRELEKSFCLIPDLSTGTGTWYLQIHLPLINIPRLF